MPRIPLTLGTVLLAAVLLSATCTPVLAADEITIVENGKSDYTIFVAKDAGPSLQWAAEELQTHIEKMSGAKLPIVHGPLATTDKAIAVGIGLTDRNTEWVPPADHFRVLVKDKMVCLYGDSKRGVLYGAYTLLDKLGVRWWTPTETYIPKLATIRLPADLDLKGAPRFEYRDMMYREMFSDEGRLWAARNRVNGMAWEDAPEKLGGRYKVSGNLVHSYLTLLKDAGVEMKPEMYALHGGKRAIDQQPCLSNTDVLAGTVKAVVAKLKSDPNIEFVVVGQMDNGNYCECPDCAAIDKEEDSHAGQVIRFANRVAEEVEKQVPGAKISTAAYAWSRKPPKNLKPRDNVYVTLCSIECDFAHPLAAGSNPENKAFKEDIEGWAKIAKKLFIWHYCGNRDHYLMPNPDLETFAPNAKFFADNKVAGVFIQGTHVGQATEFAPLRMWLWSRVLWDPSADGNVLIKEFCEGYYGPAAPAVLDYINVIHSVGHDANQMFHLGRRGWLNEPFLKPEIIATSFSKLGYGDALLNVATKTKGKPPFSEDEMKVFWQRLGHAKMPVLYVLFKRGPESRTSKLIEKFWGGGWKQDWRPLATQFASTVAEYKVNYIADPEDVKPFVQWMQDYAALIAKGPGAELPPELKDVDPNTYHLIHACQMDRGAKWWQKCEGASDGWACRISQAGWYVRHFFSPWDDFTPGKTYQLYIRVKADKVLKDGKAFECGVYPAPKLNEKIDASVLKDGQWHVVPIGKPTVWKAEGGGLYIPLTRDGAVDAIFLDCVWLQETK